MIAPGSWNLYPRSNPAQVMTLRAPRLPAASPKPWLAYGMGRSYGDVCQNDGGTLLATRALDHFLAFDDAAGTFKAQAGATLGDILTVMVPRGWFVPVTPGTRFVTLGGAVANDIHGKNHHRAGSFGCHVTELTLLRSDGARLRCAPDENAELFAATIGGLGLTGLIETVTLRLLRIGSPMVEETAQRFATLDEFFALSRQADAASEYSVGWVDCGARHSRRGVYYHGRHAPAGTRIARAPGRRTMPLTPPFSLVNPASVALFNPLYFHRAPSRPATRVVHYERFFYPLDALGHWNRIYGPRGFLQHQCVIPLDQRAALDALFDAVARSGQASFLAVLKIFGDVPSPGLLSFPRPGVTLALDFPLRGPETFALLDRLDAIVVAAGGAIYPAKDARMSPATFRAGFPRWEHLREYVDPAFSPGFWRRVTAP